ncbi:MAG: IS1595 family transposase [Acidimicrobiales bacterium]|jgi:transposase-like protein
MDKTPGQTPEVSLPPQDPQSLLEAVHYFSDPDVALDFVRRAVWPNGVPVCPHCGGLEHSFLTTRRIWKCRNKDCRRQFSAKVGTIFEDSPLGWDKWLPAVWLIANSKNSVSSHELGRSLHVTQKTAWFMLHRIRDAMETGTFRKLDGEVEVDETYWGGLGRNMHRDRARRQIKGTGMVGKTAVAGLRERAGEVRAVVVPDTRQPTLQGIVRANVEAGASVYSDALGSYTGLDADYAHKIVDHVREYVSGSVHTNGIENFWALLKRALKGTQVHIAPEHLHRYVTERTFAYNYRNRTDLGRMWLTLGGVSGRRLTYAELIGHD